MLYMYKSIHLKIKTQRDEKGWRKIFHAGINQKEVGVALLITKKIDFRPRGIIRYKVMQ